MRLEMYFGNEIGKYLKHKSDRYREPNSFHPIKDPTNVLVTTNVKQVFKKYNFPQFTVFIEGFKDKYNKMYFISNKFMCVQLQCYTSIGVFCQAISIETSMDQDEVVTTWPV